MKIAVVGSRNIKTLDLARYLDEPVEEIVSGGASGVDSLAADYARKQGLKLTEFLPQYTLYGRAAPIVRNKQIVDYADKIIVFWNGKSKGSRFVIEYSKKQGKSLDVILIEE